MKGTIIRIMKKTVLITGSSRGIGRAAALRFARESAALESLQKDSYNIVITCNKNTKKLGEVKDAVESLGCPCLAYTGDLSCSSNVRQLAGLTAHEFGAVDILINNAGVSYVGLLTDMSDSDWNNIINTNLSSIFYCCREFIPPMVSNKSGCIINISSIWGSLGASCEVAYSASKGAVNSFTRALAKELAPSGIPVNAVSCGLIDTDMNSIFSAEELAGICEEIPCGRAGTPEEAAGLIYSVSQQPSYMTGQIITIDGGWS